MIIYIDTNIFYNNWLLNSANFSNFFKFLNDSDSTLLVSEVVCDEMDQKYFQEFDKLKKRLEIEITRIQRFTNNKVDFDFHELKETYDFKNVVIKKTNKVIFIPFNDIPNSVLVNRAIKRVRPFQEQDKGFRDTIIWLSLLEYLKKSKSKGEIAFINNNSQDFFDNGKEKFHSDLASDIQQRKLKNKFKIYKSIKEFNNLNIHYDKESKTENLNVLLEEFIYPNEKIIENELESFINSQLANWFLEKLQGSLVEYNQFNFISSFEFKIYEGIEDPEIINWKKIDNSTYYTELEFELRFVSIQVSIPRSYYNKRKFVIKQMFRDIKRYRETVDINTVRRAKFNISFNYDNKNEFFEDIEINDFTLK